VDISRLLDEIKKSRRYENQIVHVEKNPSQGSAVLFAGTEGAGESSPGKNGN